MHFMGFAAYYDCHAGNTLAKQKISGGPDHMGAIGALFFAGPLRHWRALYYRTGSLGRKFTVEESGAYTVKAPGCYLRIPAGMFACIASSLEHLL